MSEPLSKPALRRLVRARILALDPQERSRQEQLLHRQAPRMNGFEPAETVLLYVSFFPEEIDTRPLIQRVLETRKRLILPRFHRDSRSLTLHYVADPDHQLRPATLGIPEPAPDLPPVDPHSIDWALIPGLAFDQHCHRLGRGAGSYDRLLPRLRPGIPLWSLALDPQWLDTPLATTPHDQPVTAVLGVSRLALRADTPVTS